MWLWKRQSCFNSACDFRAHPECLLTAPWAFDLWLLQRRTSEPVKAERNHPCHYLVLTSFTSIAAPGGTSPLWGGDSPRPRSELGWDWKVQRPQLSPADLTLQRFLPAAKHVKFYLRDECERTERTTSHEWKMVQIWRTFSTVPRAVQGWSNWSSIVVCLFAAWGLTDCLLPWIVTDKYSLLKAVQRSWGSFLVSLTASGWTALRFWFTHDSFVTEIKDWSKAPPYTPMFKGK